MENKLKNSDLDKVSGGRIRQAPDGKWMIYPYPRRFSSEKEAEEYVSSIVKAESQKNYELQKKLLDDLHIEEITPELDKVSGGAGGGNMSLDDQVDMMEIVESQKSGKVKHYSKLKRGALKAVLGVHQFGSDVKNKLKFHFGKGAGNNHK